MNSKNDNNRNAGRKKPGTFERKEGVLSFVAWWFTCSVFWIMLTGIKDLSELLFGIGAAIIPALLQFLIRAESLPFLHPEIFHFNSTFIRIPVKLLKDNYLVLKALIFERVLQNIKIRGNFKVMDFSISERHPKADAICAAYTYGISLVPNTYVVGIDKSSKKILIHELVTHPQKKELPI